MKVDVKKMCLVGMGIALYVVLSRLVSFPIFENYYICLGYFVMAFYLYSIDTVSGTLIGTLGTVLYCVLINGLRGMPGWVCGNLVIGLLLGFCFKYVKQNKTKSKLFLNFITYFTVVISVALGILGVKSLVEMFLYSQPFVVRIANNIYAFVADLIVLCLSIPLCKYIDKIIKKQGLIKNEVLNKRLYWVSCIIQNKDQSKAWCCAKSTGFLSLETAMKEIERLKTQNIVLSAWVDIFDETNNKTTVYHECFVDSFGNVR